MKPYFAKYLPVEGEIKEGDMYWFNGSPTELRKDNNDAHGMCSCKKVKLFLCSKDIQIGDKFVNPRWGLLGFQEHVCTNIEMGSGENFYPKEMIIWFKEGSVNFWLPLDKCYKVMGEISPEAIWVKEGDEFDEGDISRRGCLGDLILIKCPTCKKFH